MMAEIYYHMPMVYMLAKWMFLAAFGGIFATMSLTAGMFAKNMVVVLLTPVLVQLLYNSATSYLNARNWQFMAYYTVYQPLFSMRLWKPVLVGGIMLLICLLFGAIGYIYQQMTLLTTPTGLEETISNRRKTTHQIVTQLYEAEIIGQTLRTGRLNEYPKYKKAMKETSVLIDSLQQLLTDTLQQLRLDTVRSLLRNKEQNMILVLEAMRQNPTDELYRQQLDSLIMQQDSILNSTHVRRRVVTHHNSYTIHHKPKKFFRRLADLFSPGKPDSTQVDNIIQEESKTTAVPFKEFLINVSYGKFCLEGDINLLNNLYKTGIGSRRSEGFGLFEVL